MTQVIGLMGEKLAGKDTAAEYLITKYGAAHVRTSQILDELLAVLGLPITRRNEIEVGRGIETVFGSHAIGEAVMHRVKQQTGDLVVINGLRMKDQFEDARNLGATILYITAPADLRYQRHLKRDGKSKDGEITLEQFKAQDQEWTEKLIPELGAQADTRIDNTGSVEELQKKLDEIISNLK